MIGKLKSFTLKVIAGINIVAVIAMMISGYSSLFHPQDYSTISILGLLFPFFVIVNLIFLLFWVIFKLKGILIPVIGFLLCLPPIRNYLPLNFQQAPPDGSLKVISYNVYLFAPWDVKKDEPNPILEYLHNSDADIICLQEAETNEMGSNKLRQAMSIYPYRDSTKMENASEVMMLFSKHPIIAKKRIKYTSTGNMSMAYLLNIDSDTVIVINNHLETNSLSMEDREDFNQITKGKMDNKSIFDKGKILLKKMAKAAKKRAPQIEAISQFLYEYRGKSAIVCGDFNDTPISYTHHTISKHLTDCFVASGNGLGFTYMRNGMHARIDYIFCSKDWQPYGCMVDKSVSISDHYPVVCWLKKRGKP